jgi:phage major head subunit gpT-like protein
MIAGNVPGHLVAAARTGFLTTAQPEVPMYADIAREFDMTQKNETLVDLGAAPMPSRNRGRPQIGDFVEKKLLVQPLDWDITVFISHNAVKDDQTGELDRKVRAAGENFQRHISDQAYKALNAGDGTTEFGAGYDGLAMFHDSHITPGAYYQTAQDNKYALALSLANFTTVYTAALNVRDDQGNPLNYMFDTLIVPPALNTVAWQITNIKGGSETTSNGNPYAGSVKYIVSPFLDSTAWFLVASKLTVKPIIIAMRERPNLQSAWFDPEAPDGGRYYFKFYARYNHFYGPWESAFMGNT